MGARPMARVIQEHIKRPLAEELLFGKLAGGGHVRVELAANGEGLSLTVEPLQRELEDLRGKAGGRELAEHRGTRED
jgi:ATP-dependent Clp protease ATP-binding subunit ClpA